MDHHGDYRSFCLPPFWVELLNELSAVFKCVKSNSFNLIVQDLSPKAGVRLQKQDLLAKLLAILNVKEVSEDFISTVYTAELIHIMIDKRYHVSHDALV